MGNRFGHTFQISTFGESHGGAVGVVIDGCPSGLKLSLKKIQGWLERRRPGQSHLSTPRREDDHVQILSGVNEELITLGSPITLIVKNKDFKEDDYSDLQQLYRPSHADYTTVAKYGVRSSSGGGRASARETIGRVAAAAVAETFMHTKIPDFKCVAWVDSVKGVTSTIDNPETVTRNDVDATPLRCPDKRVQKQMEKVIIDAKKAGDSVGGSIFFGITNCPVGLGEPVFDKLEAELARAMMSLPASKGFEIGSGFSATHFFGSEHNDAYYKSDGRVRTRSNNSGGIQGGISNGEYIYGKVAFKPVSTIFKEQESVNKSGESVKFKPTSGRHDPCVLPRAVPMVEAMATLVICDHFLRQYRNVK